MENGIHNAKILPVHQEMPNRYELINHSHYAILINGKLTLICTTCTGNDGNNFHRY